MTNPQFRIPSQTLQDRIVRAVKPLQLPPEKAKHVVESIMRAHGNIQQQEQFNAFGHHDLSGNVDQVVNSLRDTGLTREAYIEAGSREPKLLYGDPEKIIKHMRYAAAQLDKKGVDSKQWMKAACIQPKLFLMDSLKMLHQLNQYLEFAENGSLGISLPEDGKQGVLQALFNNPRLLTRDASHVLRCHTLAQVHGKKLTEDYLKMPGEEVDRELFNHVTLIGKRSLGECPKNKVNAGSIQRGEEQLVNMARWGELNERLTSQVISHASSGLLSR